MESESGNRGNQQYLPDFVKEVLKMSHLLPLWTAVMTNSFGCENLTVSTAAVESSFNDVKHRMAQHITLPTRVDEFVMLHIDYLDGMSKLAAARQASSCLPQREVLPPRTTETPDDNNNQQGTRSFNQDGERHSFIQRHLLTNQRLNWVFRVRIPQIVKGTISSSFSVWCCNCDC